MLKASCFMFSKFLFPGFIISSCKSHLLSFMFGPLFNTLSANQGKACSPNSNALMLTSRFLWRSLIASRSVSRSTMRIPLAYTAPNMTTLTVLALPASSANFIASGQPLSAQLLQTIRDHIYWRVFCSPVFTSTGSRGWVFNILSHHLKVITF